MSAGYIYVLANSSMPGLVKVGMTTREPSGRADELSGATGIATPFIVVYEDYFDDCVAAETFVHTKLTEMGLRVSNSREFFRASVSDVVKVIASIVHSVATKSTVADNTGLFTASGNNDELSLNTKPWDAIMEEADRHYNGLDGYFEDHAEAIKLYKDAARLGSPQAYQRLGDIYHYSGKYITRDIRIAVEFYKEGMKVGNYACYAEMMKIFYANNDIINARKSFSKFIVEGKEDNYLLANRGLDVCLFSCSNREIFFNHEQGFFQLDTVTEYYSELVKELKKHDLTATEIEFYFTIGKGAFAKTIKIPDLWANLSFSFDGSPFGKSKDGFNKLEKQSTLQQMMMLRELSSVPSP